MASGPNLDDERSVSSQYYRGDEDLFMFEEIGGKSRRNGNLRNGVRTMTAMSAFADFRRLRASVILKTTRFEGRGVRQSNRPGNGFTLQITVRILSP